MPAPQSVIDALDARFDRSVEELIALARIPSISAEGFDARELERSALAVAAQLSDAGLGGAELLRVEGAHPYVVAQRIDDASAPTLLLYAHHDVQPPGRVERWSSPPFEPEQRQGRLYGRGVVDDKAGVAVFAAAIRAWLESEGRLPVNVKVIVEGEEEIGSDHLAAFLKEHRERLAADVIVLSDTANLEAGLPSVTTSLRGLVNVDVTVRALERPLHSGMWGGPVPDAASALTALLGRLFDDHGEIAVPGLSDDVPPLADSERAALAALPFDAKSFRADAGVLDGVTVAGSESGVALYERLWRSPAIAITALEAMPLAQAANQLIAEARARVGLRLAPGQDPTRAARVLREFLQRNPPFGARIETELESAAAGWSTRPEGAAFEGAWRALRAGYGREPVAIGCGGSIPFVAPFAEVLGGAPALLLGLEDPICNAHGENESLHLGDFRRAMYAAAHLFAELAEVPRIRGTR